MSISIREFNNNNFNALTTNKMSAKEMYLLPNTSFNETKTTTYVRVFASNNHKANGNRKGSSLWIWSNTNDCFLQIDKD